MNAIDFLIKEHNKVRDLFTDLNDPSHKEATKKKLFDTIYDELLRHEKMEQTVWYPSLKANSKINEKVKHLISEERDARKLMNHLNKIKESKEWDKEITKLHKDVEHHAKEEEKELFPVVKSIMDEAELISIGKKMREFKENYKG